MFNKPKTNPAPKGQAQPPIPPLPDLPSPGQARTGAPGQAAAPAAPPRPARGASVLASDLVFEGNVSGSGELQIDGSVKGDVRVGRLTVGETGAVEGSVQGETVEIRGRVVGSVTGKQVRLLGTAYVDGDINHEQLAIEVGAYFQGRCLQARAGQPAAAPAQPPAAPASTEPQVVELKPGA
ncbi:polymer-forming cytoskeletal protein [Brevundimonas sp.]|uniref:bactofilin family protein n=1 Tax=Brevundimonas sp. TaxID=1871086 RepID=UPI0025E90FF8|nr:polymer-forming cytoskeletal protein [Brevundimonas sp.]